MPPKIAIVVFNLGGPDSLEAVEPFLRNLFSDPAIIALPWFLRLPLAKLIARRRAPVARAIYQHLGGSSPIVPQTQQQARALENALPLGGMEIRAFIAMRCWHPFSDGAAMAVKAFNPDKIILLPLYPQFSTTTTASAFKDWDRAARKAGLSAPTTRICCWPDQPGFVAAMAAHIRDAARDLQPGLSYRLLLSAHGLPKRTIARGDPYQWQVERGAAAIVAALGMPELEPVVCYQSRVGPLEWIGPATDAEIAKAGADGKGVIVAPIAFVSEHSETLVELDIEYAKLARESGVKDYRRAPTVGADAQFIDGLAALVREAIASRDGTINGTGSRICPAEFCRCILEK
ncbi:MAG: ferrochelatase [Alphaproteobacteria bacterium]|nr:ferrochelatase [Alphaproteobacteria bacterium]